MEAKVTLRGRQVDAKIIQSVLPAAVQQYKQATGKDVEITLDVDSNLPADSCGGVELFSLQGRIKVVFTTAYFFDNVLNSFIFPFNCRWPTL